MPFDPFDPFGNLAVQDQPQSLRRIPPLKKDEEDSLLSQLTGKVLGGVGYVGGALDKAFGGRALRGVLGGRPEEALSLIPFSDTLGITNEQNRVSGEDLAKQWGVLEGEGEKGSFEARDLLGPALEMGLDPGTYLTLGAGALSKGGGIAKKIGAKMPTGGAGRAGTTLRAALDAQPELQGAATHAAQRSGLDLAGLLDQPLGGHVGVGVPFSSPSATFDLSPALDAARGLAGHVPGAGMVQKAADFAAPYARSVGAIFHKPWQGAIEPVGAEAGQNYTEALRKVGVQRDLKQAEAIRLAHGHGLLGPNQGDEIRAVMEGTLTGPPRPGVQQVAGMLKDVDAEQLARMRAAGLDVSALNDEYIQHASRQQSQLLKDTRGFVGPGRSQAVPTYTSAMEGRIDPFKDLPGGTVHGLNPLLSDPAFSGIASKVPEPELQNRLMTNAAAIRRNPALINMPAEEEALLGTLPKEIGDLQKQHLQVHLFGLPGDADIIAADIAEKQKQLGDIKGRFTKSQELARIAAGTDPQYAEKGIPFFGNHPILDTFNMAASKDRAIAGTQAITDLIGKTATNWPKPGAVQINKALAQLGLDNLPVAQNNVVAALQKYGKELPGITQAPESLMDMYVPGDVMKSASRYGQSGAAPDALRPLLDVADSFTNLFKTGSYGIWPASHIRNATGADFMNAVKGAWGIKGGRDASKLLSGEAIPGAAGLLPELAGMSDRDATNRLADLAMAHLGLGGQVGQAAEAVGPAAEKALASRVPGLAPESWSSLLPKSLPTLQDIKDLPKIRGVGGYTQTVSKPAAAGIKVGEKVESQKRLAGWLNLLEKGYTPETAAKEMLAAHGDYGNLTNFERGVMRRLVPFYNWQRQVGPEVLKELAQQPGGLIGQSVRASNDFRQQAGFVPPYIGQGMAVPVGQEDDGTQRFLSGLGLPHEQVLDLLKTGPNGAENTLMGLLGQLNPLIKGPLEYATGKQFFTGRDLEDLHAITGNTAMDQLIMNSPASRFYTSARTLADERKGLPTKLTNLLSGVKLTDVDMNKARNVQARDLVDQLLTGEPGVRKYTELYVKPEDMGQLSDRDLALLRLNRTMEEEGRKRAKQQKKVGVRAG